jgi:hypothetical protein
LNRLTNERVVAAARGEVKSGVRCVTWYTHSLPFLSILFVSSPASRIASFTLYRISLNWPLSAQTSSQKPFFNRAAFHQELIHKGPRIVNDDIWTFNTQVSSQWDGLRHFAYQKEELFYNGVTLGDIHGEGFVKTRNGKVDSMEAARFWGSKVCEILDLNEAKGTKRS